MRMQLLLGLLLVSSMIGCETSDKPSPETPLEKPAEKPRPVESKKAPMNKKGTLFLETLSDGRRRVLIDSSVCFREGPLELLLCRKGTKEHEAILHADIDAQDIHTVLMVAKAKPGSPVKYTDEKIIPATGTIIKITLQYESKPGETVTVDAREWIRNWQNKKPLSHDWVFAGSAFWKDEDDPKKPPYYLANNGNIISIANFNDAMLDLPIASSKENADLSFQAWTERIPPLGTRVTIILEPQVETEKK